MSEQLALVRVCLGTTGRLDKKSDHLGRARSVTVSWRSACVTGLQSGIWWALKRYRLFPATVQQLTRMTRNILTQHPASGHSQPTQMLWWCLCRYENYGDAGGTGRIREEGGSDDHGVRLEQGQRRTRQTSKPQDSFHTDTQPSKLEWSRRSAMDTEERAVCKVLMVWFDGQPEFPKVVKQSRETMAQ